ncbi:MAG: hypothetical protein JSU08_16860 [Acidobacteria bacterium]|nr:hypothetical protein [Acidobacteriota bacterium]
MNAAAPDLLHRYSDLGFRLVFYPSKSKAPNEKGWTEKIYTLADYQPGDNVGAMLGHEIAPGRFLADFDIDSYHASLVTRLLPRTDFAFGRASKPVSHLMVTTSRPVVSYQYRDVDDAKTVLIELRGTKQDGSVGLQTMMPPSVHPNGETVTMHPSAALALAHYEAELAERGVRHYAIGSILVRNLRHRGFGHEVRLAISGFLLQSGMTQQDVIVLGEAIATETGNDVDDVAPSVRDTAKRIREGEKVTAAGALATAIGERGRAVVARIREWLGVGVSNGDIVMDAGKLPDVVDHAEAALLASRAPIYQRGGTLMRTVRLDSPIDEERVRRKAGAVVLKEVGSSWLIEQMARSARWLRRSGDELKLADPQPKYANTLIERGEWRFPLLRAVLTAPTLDIDGRIVETPGYDADTGLLLDFAPGAFPPVPVNPTREDALAAIARLEYPFRLFPFETPAARAVFLSAMLSAIVRPVLRNAPMHNFDAPSAATGKSKLAAAVGVYATGVEPPAMSQGKSPEEDEKRLSTALVAGDTVVHIDNCEREVGGDFICSVLTEAVVQARILGLTERRLIPNTALLLASGNNLVIAGDLCTRSVICRLDAQMERPDTRRFDFEPLDVLRAHRAQLVVDGLTVLRAYRLAQQRGEQATVDGQPLRPMRSFSDYEWIRGALVWLGYADPADTQQAVLDNDPKRDEVRDVMDAWWERFGDRDVEVSDIPNVEKAMDTTYSIGEVERVRMMDPLYRALMETVPGCRLSRAWNAKAVGKWLSHQRKRIVGGRRFVPREAGSKRVTWALVAAQGGHQQSELPEARTDAEAANASNVMVLGPERVQ